LVSVAAIVCRLFETLDWRIAMEICTDLDNVPSSRQDILMKYDEYIQKIGFRFYGPLFHFKGFAG
jgi:hypothetical protein